MKIFLGSAFAAIALIPLCAAQNGGMTNSAVPPGQNSALHQPGPSNTTQPQNAMRIAPGSVIPVRLAKTVDAKKAKPGEEVDAEVTEDLKSGNGEVVVPKNTKIIGKVTEAQPRSKEQKESQLAIAFDHALTKDGSKVVLPLSIQAIIAPSYLNGGNNPNQASSAPSAPAPSSGGMAPNGRSSQMGTPQTENPAAAGGEEPSPSSANPHSHPAITGNTQGILGLENMTLSGAAASGQASVVSSEKNNVKLEGGTLLLLRVNP
jgi:hypothetical protein